jgi:hypothetical protein
VISNPQHERTRSFLQRMRQEDEAQDAQDQAPEAQEAQGPGKAQDQASGDTGEPATTEGAR